MVMTIAPRIKGDCFGMFFGVGRHTFKPFGVWKPMGLFGGVIPQGVWPEKILQLIGVFVGFVGHLLKGCSVSSLPLVAFFQGTMVVMPIP